MENVKKNKKQEVPFFARFLEEQKFPRVKTDIKGGVGGGDFYTLKWPSDEADEPIVPWP